MEEMLMNMSVEELANLSFKVDSILKERRQKRAKTLVEEICQKMNELKRLQANVAIVINEWDDDACEDDERSFSLYDFLGMRIQ